MISASFYIIIIIIIIIIIFIISSSSIVIIIIIIIISLLLFIYLFIYLFSSYSFLFIILYHFNCFGRRAPRTNKNNWNDEVEASKCSNQHKKCNYSLSGEWRCGSVQLQNNRGNVVYESSNWQSVCISLMCCNTKLLKWLMIPNIMVHARHVWVACFDGIKPPSCVVPFTTPWWLLPAKYSWQNTTCYEFSTMNPRAIIAMFMYFPKVEMQHTIMRGCVPWTTGFMIGYMLGSLSDNCSRSETRKAWVKWHMYLFHIIHVFKHEELSYVVMKLKTYISKLLCYGKII